MGVYDFMGFSGNYHVTFDQQSLQVVVQEMGREQPFNAEASFVCGNAEWTLRLYIVGELPRRLEATRHRGPWVVGALLREIESREREGERK